MKEQDISYRINDLKRLRCEIDELAAMAGHVVQHIDAVYACSVVDDDAISKKLDTMSRAIKESLDDLFMTCEATESAIEEVIFDVEKNMMPIVYGPPDDIRYQ